MRVIHHIFRNIPLYHGSLFDTNPREANSEWIEQRVGQKWQGNRDVGVIQRLLRLIPNEDEWQLLVSKRD